MKVVQARLSGTLTPGDTVMLHGLAARGGRTTAGHVVRSEDTLNDVITGLINSAGTNNFLSEYEFKAKNQSITIMCSNLVHDTTFCSEILGAGTEILTVEEL